MAEISESDFEEWRAVYQRASTSVQNRLLKLEESYELIEKVRGAWLSSEGVSPQVSILCFGSSRVKNSICKGIVVQGLAEFLSCHGPGKTEGGPLERGKEAVECLQDGRGLRLKFSKGTLGRYVTRFPGSSFPLAGLHVFKFFPQCFLGTRKLST